MGKENRKKRRRLIAGIFLILWAVFALVNAFFPPKKTSVRERRELAAFPSVTLERLLDGRFESDFETYASDQILGRDVFATINMVYNRILGVPEINGVWIGRDGWLLQDPEKVPSEAPGALLAVNRLSDDWGFRVTLAVVPDAASVMEDKLPLGAKGEKIGEIENDFDALLDRGLNETVRVADVYEALSAASETTEVYYRTDHHWTTEGAYAALPVILKTFGKEAKSYRMLPVTDEFQGTLSSKSGIYNSKDVICIPVSEADPDVPVTVKTEGKDGLRTSVFSAEGLQSDDPYRVFLGGNDGMVTVTTGREGGRLLVFKDSYFNCLLPMMLENFSEIVIIDPRFYDGDPERLLLSMRDAEVLVCYSMSGFLSDRYLSWVVPERSRK